jgi:hypothetical protein
MKRITYQGADVQRIDIPVIPVLPFQPAISAYFYLFDNRRHPGPAGAPEAQKAQQAKPQKFGLCKPGQPCFISA